MLTSKLVRTSESECPTRSEPVCPPILIPDAVELRKSRQLRPKQPPSNSCPGELQRAAYTILSCSPPIRAQPGPFIFKPSLSQMLLDVFRDITRNPILCRFYRERINDLPKSISVSVIPKPRILRPARCVKTLDIFRVNLRKISSCPDISASIQEKMKMYPSILASALKYFDPACIMPAQCMLLERIEGRLGLLDCGAFLTA